MLKGIIIAVGMLAISAIMVNGDEIYTWTDSNGTVHISQTPHKGARKFEPPAEEKSPQINRNSSNPIICLGEVNDTRYFLDRGSIRVFANDRHKYMFNLYVNDTMYECTARALPSGIIGLKPRIGMPELVERSLRLALCGK
jgi:Domain of unknown function (DUF4124)